MDKRSGVLGWNAVGLIGVIALLHALATLYGWYYTIRWFDIPMHVAGGVWVALWFAYDIVSRRRWIDGRRFMPFLVFGIATVALVGIVWEFYEFFLDIIVLKSYALNAAPGYLHFDTLKDLFDDILGGVIALCLTWFWFFRGRLEGAE